MTRIAMWSGPRNLSTAMMRSWENRPDTEVLDEPLYAAYLAATGLDHPGSRRDHRRRAERLRRSDRCLSGSAAAQRDQLPEAHGAPSPPSTSIGRGSGELRNCLLLRDPRRVLASYTKVRDEVTLDDIGIPQQVELAEHCELVVDSADFLRDPRGASDRDLSTTRCPVRRGDDAVAGRAAWRATGCGRRTGTPPSRRRPSSEILRPTTRPTCPVRSPTSRPRRSTSTSGCAYDDSFSRRAAPIRSNERGGRAYGRESWNRPTPSAPAGQP